MYLGVVSASRVIGLLHPGEMGSAVGGCLVGAGHQVLWASEGRSEASAERAAAEGLVDVGSAAALRARSDVILSVAPPAEALAVAATVSGFAGLYVDANAIAPETTRRVGELIEEGGGRFVDGGIIGGPPREPGDARLYLSGEDAGQVAQLFDGTVLETPVVSARIGDASAVKMAYAGWTKGTAALILAVRELARREGVEPALLEEWSRSQPELEARYAAAERSANSKGWRWVGEMEQIAAAMRADELPGGFHDAAAEIFARAPQPR